MSFSPYLILSMLTARRKKGKKITKVVNTLLIRSTWIWLSS